MNEHDYGRKLDELDRLLNDPDVPIEPDRVWSLLAELASRERWGAAITSRGDCAMTPCGSARLRA
ncbi:MAG: hypothetical protein KGL52_06295 [Rhodospirillales bacterium]|nr:hypothetical protein [Rhodospirillales bacterium]